MALLTVTLWAAVAVSSQAKQQLENIRQELNQASLEYHEVSQDLRSQQRFLQELTTERARVEPAIREAEGRLAEWMQRLPLKAPEAGKRWLPLPVFRHRDRERQGWVAALYEEIQRSTAELVLLKKHLDETEHRLNVAQVSIRTRRNYYQDLKASLEAKLTEKQTFLHRLQRSPRLLMRVERDELASQLSLENEDAAVSLEAQDVDLTHYRLELPVDGKIIRKFGNQVHPRYQTVTANKGIHIEAQTGQEIKAVLPGEVSFVGHSGLFGHLMMVKHSEDLSTLYSGFSSLYVEKGQKIAHRQVLGLSGHGFSLEYEGVYFEVRRKKRPIDPAVWIYRWNLAAPAASSASAN